MKHTFTRRRTAALLCAALAGLGTAARAQSPVAAPNPSPTNPTPYSSPIFHSGGTFTPPLFPAPPPLPFPDPLYSQLQGTPTGLVAGTGANAGAGVSTEIPSFLLGNYNPALPPSSPGLYFPNHFRDGTAAPPWSAPLTFTTPNAVAPAPLASGAQPLVTVESTPTAVNSTEFPFIQNVKYVGTTPGTVAQPDTTLPSGSLTVPGQHSGAAPAGSPYLIRQLVYFGRSENVKVTVGAVTTTRLGGAVYCVDGFTGEVVWRFETPSVKDPATGNYRDSSVFSTPAVAYMNVLNNSVTTPYANKAVVIVADNNGFVYCLDAAGNGDGTSNVDATTGGNRTTGDGATPIYGAQPVYPSTTSTTAGPHVGTTGVYWIYRPDPSQPNPSATSSVNFDPLTVLPVPAAFGLASPNVYVDHSISTTPDAAGKLASNAVIYLGNTRDCVYALDGLGVPNYRTKTAATPLPAYNASLTAAVTGITDTVPTCNPRWWFTPDQASNSGLSFESTPAVVPASAPFPTATVVTASPNPVPPGGNVTYKATVTDEAGTGGQITGTVKFTINGVTSAAVNVINGVATVTVAAPLIAPATGSFPVSAAYSGDPNFSGSTSLQFNEQEDSGAPGGSDIVVTSSADPSLPTQSVTFTATAVSSGPVPAPLTVGTITFTIDGAAQPAQPVSATGTATYTTTTTLTPGTHIVTAVYAGPAGVPTGSTTTFNQLVYGPPGPTVVIGSSQELGAGSNAGRLYAIDGFNGPKLAGPAGGVNHTLDQRPLWAFPNAYASGPGRVSTLGIRPALGNITGSPVVFTNTDDVITAGTGTFGTPGYVPTQYRTRLYFAADTGLEVPYSATSPTTTGTVNPRPATDTTGRVWAVNLDGTTATTKVGATTTVWSFPEANNPNDPVSDTTPEPSPPIGAFLHATPAIGVVQFPKTIQYAGTTNYTHADVFHTDVKGQSVPMLYIGTRGAADLGFYAVDIDGLNDAQRGVYRLESPTGSAFESSPVLITNPSTTASGGNGGAVFATSGNTLLQITATPISNVNPVQQFAFVGVDASFGGGGPISGPAVAAADTSDLTTAGALTTLGYTTNTTDFVYFGDGALGFCRGITPFDPTYAGFINPGQYGGITETNNPPQVDAKFPLQAYLFDGTAAHPATTADMRKALPLNSPISGFEWGGFSYIRIGNVVPPGFDPTNNPNPALLVADPTDASGTTFYGSGGTVNFSVGNAGVVVPATVLSTLTGGYPEAGLIHRTDPPAAGTTKADPGTDPSTQLVTPAGSTGAGFGWIAVYSYPIGSDQTRVGDTPGAFRRVRQANQTATRYIKTTSGSVDTYTASGVVSLSMQTGIGAQYVDSTTPTPTIKQTPPTEQPTFGILNPLAVQGFGVPLNITGSATPPTAAVRVGDIYDAGPFGPISSPTSPTVSDLSAFVNGSNYIPKLPTSGYDVAHENPLAVTQYLSDQSQYAQVPIAVATSVGDIVDGTTGDNRVPGSFGLNVQNRSLVRTPGGTPTSPSNPFPAIPVAMQPVVAHWNDNTNYGTGGLPQNEPGGPGATINPLPWEDFNALSSVSANASLDYPDIPASAITHKLVKLPATVGGVPPELDLDTSNGAVTLDPQTGPAGSPTYQNLDYIHVSVAVPQHQPANLQLWDSDSKIPTTPATVNTSHAAFPHGYIEGSGTGYGNSTGGGTPQHLYVDLSTRGQFNTIYPYRDVQTFAGVPVNMKTTIADGVIGIPTPAPAGLGLQTEAAAATLNLGLFGPYTPSFQPFFRPMTVHNDGNVNLLNVHFNQQMNNGSPVPLYAYADGNDPLSFLIGFDAGIGGYTAGPVDAVYLNRLTAGGAAIPVTGSVSEQAFLYRTSLDTDMVQAYGRNPLVAANFGLLYPAATFHKPRAGGGETTLTVPDMPDTGGSDYSLPTAAVPTLTAANTVAASAPPYVGIAVPFGTPVGTYHTNDNIPLRLFEGYDLPGSGTANPYKPPTYGYVSNGTPTNGLGGHFPPGDPQKVSTVLSLNPTATATATLPENAALQPVSNPGVKLQIKVVENRMTDGFTFGALPMIDAGPAGGTGGATPDFAPAAFRDFSRQSISVYWTSGRTGAYSVSGVNVPFKTDNSKHFNPGGITGNATTSWYGPISPLSLAPGVNSSLSIMTGADQTYRPLTAFDVAVSTAAPYTNILYAYEMDPSTGKLFSFSRVTPSSDDNQVKYGVKGLDTGTQKWAFWTAATRGRTALYYSPRSSWNNPAAPPPTLLPVPAGLTAVSDVSPLYLPFAPVLQPDGTTTLFQPVIEATYTGTGPDGNADLYVSRYQPGATAATAGRLSQVPFPPVTENLRPAAGGWYQSRDTAWSRAGALNVSVLRAGVPTRLLYDAANLPLFSKAVYDKASGFLVLTGVQVPILNPPAGGQAATTNTVTVDAATGRVRFTPALDPARQNFTAIQATFSPLARRLTTDSRADVGAVTFLDTAQKENSVPNPSANTNLGSPIVTDRRWTIWRKSADAGGKGTATLYFKTQRLTFFLPTAIGVTTNPPASAPTFTTNISSVKLGSGTDVTGQIDVDYSRGRLYFPISTGAEGQTVSLTYTDTGGTSHTVPVDPLGQNTVQWQDELPANDTTDPAAREAVTGLDTVIDTPVPISTGINESNVAAFLDPLAGANSSHKVWLFWNSTRNGTADIYSETIDPLFAPIPPGS